MTDPNAILVFKTLDEALRHIARYEAQGPGIRYTVVEQPAPKPGGEPGFIVRRAWNDHPVRTLRNNRTYQ